MQIGRGIISQEDAKNTGVCFGVGGGNITNLEIHLECATPFVSSNFDPDLCLWYHTIMPGEVAIAGNSK